MLELYEGGSLGNYTIGEDALGEGAHITATESFTFIYLTEADLTDAPLLTVSDTIATETTLSNTEIGTIAADPAFTTEASLSYAYTRVLFSSEAHSQETTAVYEDTPTLSTTENRAITIFFGVEDAVSMVAAEALNTLDNDFVAVADSDILSVVESLDIQATTSKTVTYTLKTAENAQLFATVAQADAGTATSVDDLAYLIDVPLSDSGTITESTNTSIYAVLSRSDFDRFAFTETASIFVPLTSVDEGSITDKSIAQFTGFINLTNTYPITSVATWATYDEETLEFRDSGLVGVGDLFATDAAFETTDGGLVGVSSELIPHADMGVEELFTLLATEGYEELYLSYLEAVDSGLLTAETLQTIVTDSVILTEPVERTIPELRRIELLPYLREDIARDSLHKVSLLPFIRKDVSRDTLNKVSLLPYLVKQGKLYDR